MPACKPVRLALCEVVKLASFMLPSVRSVGLVPHTNTVVPGFWVSKPTVRLLVVRLEACKVVVKMGGLPKKSKSARLRGNSWKPVAGSLALNCDMMPVMLIMPLGMGVSAIFDAPFMRTW